MAGAECPAQVECYCLWIPGNIGKIGNVGNIGNIRNNGNTGKIGKLGIIDKIGKIGNVGSIDHIGNFSIGIGIGKIGIMRCFHMTQYLVGVDQKFTDKGNNIQKLFLEDILILKFKTHLLLRHIPYCVTTVLLS